jgi:DNA-binding transcriptional MocR family regulator
LTGLAAGFHAVAHLPDGLDEARVVAAARDRSVGLYGMSAFRADGQRCRRRSSSVSATSAIAPSVRGSPPSPDLLTTPAE